MTLLSKILVGFILLASIPYFYLAARTLRTHETHRNNFNAFVKKIDAEKQRQKELDEGKYEGGELKLLGVRQAKVELDGLLSQRGRAWRGCITLGAPDNNGTLKVQLGPIRVRTTEGPARMSPPNPNKPAAVVYVFEEGNLKGGRTYIGEFKVIAVEATNEQTVATLTPALALNPPGAQAANPYRQTFAQAFLDRLRRSQQNQEVKWTLYDVMPVDLHEAFADLQPDEFENLVPVESVEEYKRDGSESQGNDPPERVIDGKYVRRLRDYAVIYRDFDRLVARMNEELVAMSFDNDATTKALTDARQDLVAADQHIADAEAEKAVATKEKEAADAHLANVERERDRLQGAVDAAFAKMKKLGEDYARLQLETLNLIERRVRSTTASRN